MSRGTWVFDPQSGELVPKHQYCRPVVARSELPAPMVIRDFQSDVFSHVDGRTYSSRKHWNDHLKAHGMVELGNDMPSGPKPTPGITEQDIADAYDQVEVGNGVKLSENPPEGWEGDV